MYQRNRKENSITGREIGVIRKRYLYDLENKKTETPKVQKSIMPTRDMQGPKNLDPNIRKKIEESRAIDYASIPKRPDFMEKSKSAGEKPGFLYETFKDTLFDWGQFNKKEKNISTLTERAKLQKHTDMQGIGNQDDIGRAINSMSDTDRGIYNYLFNTYGKDKADKYLKDYALKHSKESTEKMMKDVKEYSEKHPVLGSAASVLTTPAKWVGMYNEVYNKTKNTNEPINPYGVAYFYNNLQEAAREGVTQDMGQTGNFLYSTGMSILDSLVASTAGPLGGAAILGGGAGTDAIKDAKERGASDNQALLTGIASGTAEALFEKISLGNLKSLSEVPISSVKDIAKNVVKSVFVNASEEAATELSNTITDHIIMQDLSNYNLAYEHYLSLGMGEEEAKKRASMDMAKQIGLSALGGALSGGVMGGAGQGINYLRGSSIGRNIDTGDIDNMVDMAKTSDGTSDLYRLALEIEKRKQADKPPTNYQKGRLAIETTRMDMLNNSLHSEETSMPTQPIETPTYESKQPRIERENVKDAQATWNGIEGAKVKGISKVENNVAKVTIESGGETIIDNLSNVEFSNPNTKAIYDMSEQYKTNGAKSFVSNYQDNLDLDIYKKGFDAYYDAGLVDLPMDKVNSAYGSLLDETVRYAAYESGQNDGKALAPKTVAQDFIGVVETEASSKMDVNNREALDALGKAVGLKIQIEESLAGGEANGYYKDGTLYIALDSQNPYMVVAKHELTHSLQESSPDLYKKYKDFVISEINKSNPEAYNEMVDRLISRYSEIGENLTRDQAQDEIVADATEMFFTDSDIISRLANEDKTLADKIIGFIKDLISKLQNAIQGVKPRSRAAIALNENLEIAKKAEKLWTEALFGVQDKKTSSNLDGEKNTKFSLRENILDEKVDKSSDVYYNNIKDTLVKNFSEYKSNKEALNYATEAIKDLGKIRFSLSDKRGDVDRNKSGIRTIADGITRDFINKGYVDLKGRRVNSPADLAEIAQVFRDPRFETFRIFYVKNNKIVAHEGITSRIPGTAVAFMNIPRASDFKNDYDYNVALSKFHATKFDDMINRMKRLKADGYYLLHNHPSGSPDPSQADILVTRDYRYAVPGFKGHVIINSNTYGVLDLNLPLDKQPIHSLSQQRLDFLLQPSKQHKLLNQKINSVDSLSAVAKSLQLNKDVSCVIYTSAKGEVRGIQEIANGFIMSDDFKGYVKNQSLHFGSALAFIHTNSNDILKRSVELIEKKYLTDGVITHADGSTESLRGMGHTQDNKYQWAGIEAREISGYRVNENQYSLKDNTASYTEKRMNLILDKYGAKSSPKYSKAYVTYISPSDFLSLTTNNLSRIESESTELDIQKLQSEYQEIFLRSDMDTGEVTGHEGRHRMVALRNAGINEVPILIIPEGEKGRYNRTKIAEHKLNGEEFSTGKAKGIVDVKNLIPASYEYRDELINTFVDKSDVRFSLKDVDPIEYRNLKKEHKKLQEAYDLLSQQFALTAEFAPDKTILERRAKSILRKYHSKYDLDTMVENMENIWKYVQSNKDTIQVGQTVNALSGMAKMILEKSTARDTSIRDQYKDLINDIKKTGVMLSHKDRADLASEGGYYAFKRRYRNKIKLVEDGGISIDSYFQELASTYPEFFNADEITHPAEQLVKIAEVLDSLKPISYNPYGMNIDEASIDLALEILDQGFLIPQVKPLTAAELKQNLTETEIRQRKELERLHTQYQEKIENVRQEYRTWFNERLGRIKTENEAKVKKLLEQHNKANEREKEILMRQIQRLRDSKLQRLQAQQERYNERMHAYKQRKSVQADMNKWKSNIRKIAKDLSTKLLRPTDKKHIPAGLKSSIIQVCQLLDFETGRTGPQGEPTQVALKLRNLQSEYAKLANETDESISAFYDEDMSIALTELAETTQGRRINQLSYDELKQVQDIMRHIRHIVNLENKMFSENIRESIAFAGESQIAHHNSSKEFKQMDVVAKSKALKAFSDLLGKGNIKPYYFFKQLGGSLHSLYKNIRDGEDAFIKNFEKGKDYAKDIISKYDYFSWAKNDKPQEFVTSSGESIYLTTGEKLYIYMAYQREQGKGHILGGGVVPSSQVSKKGKTSEQSKPIRFDEGDMTKLASTLTDEQINFAKEMGEYLSNDLAQLGNEVSLKMYGYEKFTEKNYIPLTSDPNFLTSRAGVVDDRRIKRAGFTKATTPKANNPVIAADFLEVWSKHLTDMSMYNAFVLPITDFERVWNYRVKDKDGKISSVKSAIQREYGKRANDYIKNLLNDINGGIKAPVGGELSNILLAKMKADAVMGNLSVAIQQPSAIARALVIIDPKYFVKTTFSKRDYNELKKYSPQAILKEYGYFDVNMGRNLTDLITQPDYEGPMEKFKAFFTDKNVRNEVFSWLPQKMDEITWAHIWNAIKAETKAETKLIEGSEEFYQHVAERFKEVIDRSQVMDSVFQRSEIMRSQNFAAKLATSFMSEPTVNYNMLYDAVSEYKKKGKSITPYVTRSVASVVSAMVLNSILKSIVTAMRSKDDKEYAEKYLDSFVSNLLDDPVSMIPYVNTVFSIFQGYNANRPDMQIVQNLYYAGKKLDSDKYSTNEKALQVAQAIAPFFNVPLKSLTRDIESIFRTGKKAFEKAGLTEELPKYESLKIKYDINDLDNSKASSEYYDYLYSIRGTEEYNEVYRELIKSGRKPTNINQAMSNREKLELYNRKKDEEYTHPLIIEAVDAIERSDAKGYKAAISELQKEYEAKVILSAINSLKSERAKENAPSPEEFVEAYKAGDKEKWLPLFRKLRAAGWSQKDLLELVK